jgi:hypothetical protein
MCENEGRKTQGRHKTTILEFWHISGVNSSPNYGCEIKTLLERNTLYYKLLLNTKKIYVENFHGVIKGSSKSGFKKAKTWNVVAGVW